MKNLLIILITLLMQSNLYSQQDYEKWQKEESKIYKEYIDEKDKQFAEFLKKEWKQVQLEKGLVSDVKPKPVNMPVITDKKDYSIDEDVKYDKVIVPDIKIFTEDNQPVIKPPKIDEGEDIIETEFNYFDLSLKIHYPSKLKSIRLKKVNNETISEYWEKLSRINYKDILAEIKYFKDKMGLNDWGFCLLINSIGRNIYNSDNEAILFNWFVLAKSGYDVKIGYDTNQLYLLIFTNNKLFGELYFSLGQDKRRYYALKFHPDTQNSGLSLYTYEGNYPDATKSVDFSVNNLPVLDKKFNKKSYSFHYLGKDYKIHVDYNVDAVNFFKNYPQTELENYFNSPISDEARNSLYKSLKSLIENKTQIEAVNILLRFVQTAFKYKTDQENFGREKPLFPDETLYYDASDCEDRAILFTTLLKDLTGLDVIGISYPGHIAAAVKFDTDVPGASITYENYRYIICDPTYINADVGMTMPEMRDCIPQVVKINRINTR